MSLSTRSWTVGVTACLIVTAIPGEGVAQQCPAGVISTVEVERLDVFDPEESKSGLFRWAFGVGNKIHMTTSESYIRADLLFEEGDCFDPFLIDESARVLRERGFIKWAEITYETQPDGNVAVHVSVQDDWTLKVGLGLSFDEGFKLEELLLKEMQLFGRGLGVALARAQDRDVLETSLKIKATRLLGSDWTADLEGGSTRYGNFFEGELAYPFYNELSEVAASGWLIWREDYFPYTTSGLENPTHTLLPYEFKFFQATWGHRFGDPGGLWVIGGGLSREDLSFPEGAEGLMSVIDGEFGDAVPATEAEIEAVRSQTTPFAATRLNVFAGWRKISFVMRERLDRVLAAQDVMVGSEVTLSFNPSIPVIAQKGDAEDIHGKFEIFWGAAPGRSVFAATITGEGRYAYQTEQGNPTGWRDILTEVDLKWFVRPTEESKHTLFTRISAARSWDMDRPFQLTGGGRDGVRGYSIDAFPGGRRLLATLEDRFPLVSYEAVDVGLSLFGDLGKVWGQDVPWGVDSGWRSALGLGLRLNFPSGGIRTMRLDFTLPLSTAKESQGVYFRMYTELGGLSQLRKRWSQTDRSRWSGIDTDLTTKQRKGG